MTTEVIYNIYVTAKLEKEKQASQGSMPICYVYFSTGA